MSGLAIPASAARWTGTSGGPEAGPSDLLGCPDHRAAPFRGRLGPVPFSQMTPDATAAAQVPQNLLSRKVTLKAHERRAGEEGAQSVLVASGSCCPPWARPGLLWVSQQPAAELGGSHAVQRAQPPSPVTTLS